jgi:hypothetical protein
LSLELLRLRAAYLVPPSSSLGGPDSDGAAPLGAGGYSSDGYGASGGSRGSSRSASPCSSCCGGSPRAPAAPAGGGGPVDVEGVARELGAAGYLVHVQDEAPRERRPRDARRCLQQLRHRFILCLGARGRGSHSPPGGGGGGGGGGCNDGDDVNDGSGVGVDGGGEPLYLPEPLVVEPCLREQFVIAHPTPAYTALLEAAPLCFVGPASRLDAAVDVLCREMAAAFRERGLAVPPWRTKAAMLSKWAPQQVAALAAKACKAGPRGVAKPAAAAAAASPVAAAVRLAPSDPLPSAAAAAPALCAAACAAQATPPALASKQPDGAPGPHEAPATGEPLVGRNATAESQGRATAGQKARSLLAMALRGPGGTAWGSSAPGSSAGGAACDGGGGTRSPRGGSPQGTAAAAPAVIRTVPNEAGWGCITTVRWGALHSQATPGHARG